MAKRKRPYKVPYDAELQLYYFMKEQGYYFLNIMQASTGTYYIRGISLNGLEVKVRVSNHSEVYYPNPGVRQISVSPFELNITQAKKLLKKPENIEPYNPENKPDWQYQGAKEHRPKWLILRNKISNRDWVWFKKHPTKKNAKKLAKKYNAGTSSMWSALNKDKY